MSSRLLGLAFGADMGTGQRKLVLLKLVDHCHDDGTRIFPAVASLAKAAQCSARSVQREMKRFVEVGLVRLVREGGKGKGSTNEYALDLEALRIVADLGWDAWVAQGAPTTSSMAANLGENAKGDTVSPLEPKNDDRVRVTETALRVTPTTSKGDSESHPNPQEPLEPSIERERAGARTPEGVKGDQPDRSPSGGTTSGEERKAGEEAFHRFWRKWPNRLASSKPQARKAWMALSPDDRNAALAGIVPYHEALKASGHTHARKASTYLAEKPWEDLEREPQPGGPYLPPEVRPYSALWTAALAEMLRTGLARQKRWMFSQLCAGQATNLCFGRERDGELVVVAEGFDRAKAEHPRGAAFLAWLEAQLSMIGQAHLMPRLRDDFWLHVPPPAVAKAWGIPLSRLGDSPEQVTDAGASQAHTPPDMDPADAFA